MSDVATKMVRYGRKYGPLRVSRRGDQVVQDCLLKNCLVTLRRGDLIYYGISRCNLNAGDRFDRHLAAERAHLRAVAALLGDVNPGPFDRKTLQGCVHVDRVVELLSNFRKLS